MELFKLEADMYLPLHLSRMFTQLQVQPAEKIGDHQADVVVGSRDGQPPVWLYFDQESHLLVRMVRFVESPLGRSPLRIDYADYRTEGGVKIPFRWTTAQPQGVFITQVDQVEENGPIDDSKFARPAVLEKIPGK
jgi:photosynthetic reaction center cytochrome c subunit